MNEKKGAPSGKISCVGIIMDGNRRWAAARGLPKLEGHRAGVEALKKIVRTARDQEVEHLAIYAFSTENWKRASSEITYLMGLFQEGFQEVADKFGKEGIRVRFLGQLDRFAKDMQKEMDKLEKDKLETEKMTLWVCLSYGGRAEIAAAARQAAATGEEITEEALARNLWTKEMPDPDIIIRTGGEKRLSGFLPWQSVYSELFFTDSLWPAFTEEEFLQCLAEYRLRKRNFGA